MTQVTKKPTLQNLKSPTKDFLKGEVKIFKRETFKLLQYYDEDFSGELSLDECRILFNDLRATMYLPKCDDDIINRCFEILDKDQSGTIDLTEFHNNINQIFPIQQELGNDLTKQIKFEFYELDVDNSGYLEPPELKKLFTNFARNNNLPKPKKWHVEHIMAQQDDDGNGKLDLGELIGNYRLIMKEMIQLHKIANIWDDSTDIDSRAMIFGKLEHNMKLVKDKRAKEMQEKGEVEYSEYEFVMENEGQDKSFEKDTSRSPKMKKVKKKRVSKLWTADKELEKPSTQINVNHDDMKAFNNSSQINVKERIAVTDLVNNNQSQINIIKRRETDKQKKSTVIQSLVGLLDKPP